MCLYTLQRNESFAPLQREKWSLSTLNTAILFCTHTQAKSVPSICLLLFTSSVLPYSVQYTLKMKLLPQSHSLTACFHCLGNIGTVAFIFPKMHTMGIMYVTCITWKAAHLSAQCALFNASAVRRFCVQSTQLVQGQWYTLWICTLFDKRCACANSILCIVSIKLR